MNHKKLSVVLSEFARTMLTDFPIQSILDHLVERIVEVLPITSAGVTLISENLQPHYIAASDESAMKFERLQAGAAEGPCLTAYRTGVAVAIADLRLDQRFPHFGPAAVEAGLVAVFALPLRHGRQNLGALDLYRTSPGLLEPDAMEAAQTLADVAAAYLLNARARDEARVTSEEFLHRSLHDSLTGLPNRVLLEERLEHASRRALRSRTSTAMLFVDLDRFKEVNDTFGHGVGDELLRLTADRLRDVVRSGDTLSRLSGDEFVILCEELRGLDDVEILASRVSGTFAEPFVVADRVVAVSASIGVAFAGPGEDISPQLLVHADHAMYAVKRNGGGGHRVIVLREVDQASDRLLEADLRIALARDEFDVVYQPIVDTAEGRILGVEALLRWTCRQRGQVSPTTIIEAAERSDLINDIGRWVLERACRDRGQWLRAHPEHPLDLAVNVSASQLAQHGFTSIVRATLRRTGMDARALVLEMTEGVFVAKGEEMAATLTDLKRLGVRLAIDDFGSGYSSLSYLRRLPIDIVKIDQTFIAALDEFDSSTIVEAVTNLAHALRLSVVAEGVETASQRAQLTAIGCEQAQGYFFARPMSATAICGHLDSSPGSVCFPAGQLVAELAS